ncbi:MAG TPA: hypothetical protein DCM05_11475 [Elusimicrobia bacterium]|nr:hypothetical protein [Elusimicrobiota bacterium]
MRTLSLDSASFAELALPLLQGGRSIRFAARGSSMAPLIREGDILEVASIEPGRVRLGDVLLCRSEGKLIAHRVVRRGSPMTLKADLGEGFDLVESEEVLGRVERSSRLELGAPLWRWLGLAWCAVPYRFKPSREVPLIRPAVLGDAKALYRALPAGSYEEFLEGLREELAAGVRFLAWTPRGEVVGSATLSSLEGGGQGLFGLWVHPRWRNRGLGERLCLEALSRAGGPVELHVSRRARAAIRLYRRLGFQVFRKSEDELSMFWHRLDVRKFLAASGAEGLPRSDWDEVLAEAGREGVPCLLERRLSRVPEGLVPPAVLKTLKGAVYHNVANGARLGHWAERAAEALAKAGLKTCALKGLAMAEPDLRPMTDADLLAEEAAQGRARDILAPLGFVHQPGRQECYRSPEGDLLEIHYQGDYAFWDMRGMLKRALPCGKPYLLPCHEDMLIFAGLHTVFHKLELKLVWLFDAKALIRDGVDWGRLLSLMDGHPGRPALAHFLESAREECGAEVPEDVLERLREDGWRSRAVEWILGQPPHPWLEPFAAHFLGRDPAVPLRNLSEILWPTGPRLACRVGPGQSVLLWRMGRPFYLLWRVLRALGFILLSSVRGSRPSSPSPTPS